MQLWVRSAHRASKLSLFFVVIVGRRSIMPLVGTDHVGHPVDTASEERQEEQQCRHRLF